MRRFRTQGLTLIEVLVAVAISAILLASAAPSFIEMVARVRLEGAVNGIAIDLQYARSEAIRRRTSGSLVVASGGASYTLSYVDPVSGATTPLKVVTMPTGVTLSASGSIVFDALRGIAASQTLTGSSSSTIAQLQVQTNAIGRVQMCSPSGSFRSYATC